MTNENEYSAIIPVYMQLCRYSECCNVKQSVQTSLPPFSCCLRKTAVTSLPLCTQVVTLFQFNSIIMFLKPFFLRLCMRNDQPLMTACTTQMQVCSRDRWERVERKLLNVQQKICTIQKLCAMMEKTRMCPRMRRCTLWCRQRCDWS